MKTPPTDQEFLTTKELADWLKVSRFTIYRLIVQGLPHSRLGAHHRFKRAEVEAWMKACAAGDFDGTSGFSPINSSTFPCTQTHSVSIGETIAQLKELTR